MWNGMWSRGPNVELPKQKAGGVASSNRPLLLCFLGAGYQGRTGDIQLGKRPMKTPKQLISMKN